MLRQSQKAASFSVEEYNLQAPDRRAMYRTLNAKGVLNRRKSKRVTKVLDILLVIGCLAAAVYVGQDITRQAYEHTHHTPLTWELAVDYAEDFFNLP